MFKEIRKKLIDDQLKIKDLAAKSGISYDRLVKCINGFAKFNEDEKTKISQVLNIPREEIG